MSATPQSDTGKSDDRPATLGDVLYPTKDVSLVSEDEWYGLVQAIAARDQRALHALYERTHRIVFTLIMRIVGNRHTAEELTLDVFHDIWRRAPQYERGEGSVVGWTMNQARSRAIDRLRHEQRKKRTPPEFGGEGAGVTDGQLEQQEQSRLLREALTQLTSNERHAIETAYFSEMTYAEVATQLNEPLGTVKTRIRSALAKLRSALAREESA